MRIGCAPEVRGSQEVKIVAGPARWRAPAARSNPTLCLKTAIHRFGRKPLGVHRRHTARSCAHLASRSVRTPIPALAADSRGKSPGKHLFAVPCQALCRRPRECGDPWQVLARALFFAGMDARLRGHDAPWSNSPANACRDFAPIMLTEPKSLSWPRSLS
jgi:hypothetical protein